ncbi:hypothetical protein [Oceanibaculum pacificum]|nr:hypothetical protein [Oceanibaculum pacificum]
MKLWMIPAFGLPMSGGLYLLNHRIGGLALVAMVFATFISVVFAATR